MRLLVIATLVVFGVVYGQDLKEGVRWALQPGDSAEVAAALELRCGDAADVEQRLCEEDLRKAFSSGERDASDIVRLHCTRFDNRWADARAHPEVCNSLSEG